jgi:hypothetical protein
VIQLILFLLVGFLLLVSLLIFAKRGRAEGGSEALVEACQALRALQFGLLSPEILARIFATSDQRYIRETAPREVQELFRIERQRITLSWVNRVREQISSLQRFHSGSARFYARLSFRTELELALQFAGLRMGCSVLQLALRFGGPYAAPAVVSTTASAAARVCAISEKSLAFLTATQFAAFDQRSPGPVS